MMATLHLRRGTPRRQRHRLVGLLLTLVVAPACLLGCEEITRLANPEVPLWYHHPGRAMSIFIRRQLTAEPRKQDEPDERATPAVDPTHRRVFMGSSDRGLYALSAVNGSTIWRFETAGSVQSEPLYDPGRDVVYFGSNDGAAYCLRAADGALLWRFATAARVTRQPVLHRGTLYVVNGNDYLIAINAATGKLRWYQHRTPAFGMEISGCAGAAVFEDKVYTAYSDGVVMAYSTDNGAEKWSSVVDLTADAEQSRTGEELRYLDVDTTPVVARLPVGDLLFVASYEGGLYALDAHTGAQVWVNDAATGITELTLWQAPARPEPLPLAPSALEPEEATEAAVPAGSQPAPAAQPGPEIHRVLIASSGLTGLWGFDPSTGKKLWRRDLPAGGVSKAVPWAGAVLVGTTRYGLFLLSPLNDGIIDGVHSGGTFAAAPATHGLRAYIISSEGVFFGLTLRRPPSAEERYAELLAAKRAALQAAGDRAEAEAAAEAEATTKPEQPTN